MPGDDLMEQSEDMRLSLGERKTLTLSGLASAGYQWTVSVDDPAIVAVEPLDAVPSADPQRAGGYDARFALAALQAGETTVTFQRQRPFGPPKPPNATRTLRVRVTP